MPENTTQVVTPTPSAPETVPEQRSVAYYFKDSVAPEPFPILASANAWWMDGEGIKLYKVMSGVREHFYVKDALHLAGITMMQWKYFNNVHPDFYPLVELFQESYKYLAHTNVSAALKAKKTVTKKVEVKDATGNKTIVEEEREVPDIPMRFTASKWYLERIERQRFGASIMGSGPVAPPGGSALTLTETSFRDKTGKVIMSRQAAEYLQEHGTEYDDPTE